jgi:membrane-bound lytic murein transglycosylase B
MVLMAALLLMVPARGETASPAASDKAFRQWVERLWPAARAKGVSRATFDAAFRGVTPDPEVVQAAHYQPEFVRPIWDYLASAVSDERIRAGQELLETHRELFDQLEQRYQVDRHVVLAIWGMESNFGSNKGELNVIRSLATLAYRDRRRSRFGRTQLLSALRILQHGDIAPAGLVGSWAGAMGHTQFIPTTYDLHAVDFDGDGKRDIWNDMADSLASTANYLHKSNWRGGADWGYEVELPARLKSARVGMGARRPVKQWMKAGVMRTAGREFPDPAAMATLFLPAGGNGPAFLVLGNFRSIMRYNNATAYALAVGHLADRLRGAGPLVAVWPTGHKPLARDQRVELQQLLTAKGFDTGGMDGIIGDQTLRALRAFQKSRGIRPEGWPSVQLLERLRQDG